MPEPISPLISKSHPLGSSRLVYQSAALFFNIVVVAFVFALIFWGGLFFYNRSLRITRDQWAEKIKKEEERFNAEGGIGRLVETSNALNAAKELIDRHVFPSNTIAFLEESTHKRVQFSKMTFARDARKMDLAGSGASYRTVAEQVSILEGHTYVERVDFGGLSVNAKGLVDFKLAIVFKPSLLELRVRPRPAREAGPASLPDGSGD